MREFEKILKALANKRRLEILKYLKSKKEANVGSIAEKIKLSFKSTSRHLAILLAVDILTKEQRSLEAFYSISPELSQMAKDIIFKI
ncbi:hypothetical protein A3A09_01025 [Candidatus Nomurabacteria bacterium RIFCSPLOWO2_01_FULL_42_20]|uniref:HTH arsR-type domain-containing protein n=1 Tax=Candidatus Nomurabacteria bacterium RIFCSPHIGHO2_01_FULL_42_16 TaxID=1801743 RepID=A0A1F6VIJ7_9BACT|nr:MAG: hypothetical protein A2824_03270 [Candidatus Nomurabacteria bacterium RIFCSPHIGHO2_01_FULL_42_16]OGI91833.1 MAG: hypothetical protein A3A09_01025 [Candidatus Nomurabacteria bacterium RIFCSPLOWO2_01_FULL_42_20]